MLFAGIVSALATTATSTIASAVTSGVVIGSSVYLTSRTRKNSLKMSKK